MVKFLAFIGVVAIVSGRGRCVFLWCSTASRRATPILCSSTACSSRCPGSIARHATIRRRPRMRAQWKRRPRLCDAARQCHGALAQTGEVVGRCGRSGDLKEVSASQAGEFLVIKTASR